MRIHIVQKGDTLWKIAHKYNVDFEQLKSLNSQLSDPNMIMPGMKIKVPTGKTHVKKHKEMPIKEAPVKEMPVKEAPQPIPIPPPMPELPKYPVEVESPEYVPPMPEAELPIEQPPMPPPMPPPMQIAPMPQPCGCAPIMPMPCPPMPCKPMPLYGHHEYGPMMPMPMNEPVMGIEVESSNSIDYAMEQDDSPMFGSGHGWHGQPMPAHGWQGQWPAQGWHGQQMPAYGWHGQWPTQGWHGQHQGMYGQQMPVQGAYGQQYMPLYPQGAMQHGPSGYEQMDGQAQMMQQMPYEQHMMPIPGYNAPLFNETQEMLYREPEEQDED